MRYRLERADFESEIDSELDTGPTTFCCVPRFVALWYTNGLICFFFEISRIFEFFFEESEALILVKLFGYSYSKTKFTMRSLQLATGVSRTVIGKSGCGF